MVVYFNILFNYWSYRCDWDWTLAFTIHPRSIEFDPSYGLGTWGKAEADWHVRDGAFSNVAHTYPVRHTIRGKLTPQPFEESLVFPFEYSNKTAWANETANSCAIGFMVDNFEVDSAAFFYCYGSSPVSRRLTTADVS